MFTERWTMSVPEASANRPVPLVMVCVSTIAAVGNVTTARPLTVVEISSPFAAVHVAVPDAVLTGGGITVNADTRVNRPRCVASPLPLS